MRSKIFLESCKPLFPQEEVLVLVALTTTPMLAAMVVEVLEEALHQDTTLLVHKSSIPGT